MTVTSYACKHVSFSCHPFPSDLKKDTSRPNHWKYVLSIPRRIEVFFPLFPFSLGLTMCGHCFSFPGVDVAISLFPPISHATSANFTIIVGHSKRLHCYGMSGVSTVYPDRYSWYKDGKLRTGHRGYFGIPKAHHDDKGIYTCTLRNTAGFVTIKYEVIVVGKHYHLYFSHAFVNSLSKVEGFLPIRKVDRIGLGQCS